MLSDPNARAAYDEYGALPTGSVMGRLTRSSVTHGWAPRSEVGARRAVARPRRHPDGRPARLRHRRSVRRGCSSCAPRRPQGPIEMGASRSISRRACTTARSSGGAARGGRAAARRGPRPGRGRTDARFRLSGRDVVSTHTRSFWTTEGASVGGTVHGVRSVACRPGRSRLAAAHRRAGVPARRRRSRRGWRLAFPETLTEAQRDVLQGSAREARDVVLALVWLLLLSPVRRPRQRLWWCCSRRSGHRRGPRPPALSRGAAGAASGRGAAFRIIDAADDPAAAYREAVEMGASAVLGPVHSWRVREVLGVRDANDPPLFLLSSVDGVEDSAARVARLRTSPADQSEALAGILLATTEIRDVAVLAPDDAYGEESMLAFVASMQQWGGRIDRVARYPAADPDVSEALEWLVGQRRTELVTPTDPWRTPPRWRTTRETGLRTRPQALFIPDYAIRSRCSCPTSPSTDGWRAARRTCSCSGCPAGAALRSSGSASSLQVRG